MPRRLEALLSVRIRHASAITLTIVGLFVALMGSANADEYYKTFSNAVMYIAWTEGKNGDIRGQVQLVRRSDTNPANLQSSNGSFTGLKDGTSISMSFPIVGYFSGQTWTGKIGWRSLSLIMPGNGSLSQQTLNSGTFSDYQKAEQRLVQAVSAVRTQQEREAAVAQAQAESAAAATRVQKNLADNVNEARAKLDESSQSIGFSIKSLDRAFETGNSNPKTIEAHYEAAWVKMQRYWAQEQAAADVRPMTCYQKSQVVYVSTEVAYELTEIKYVDSELNYLKTSALSDFKSIANALAINETWAPLYDQRYRAYTKYTNGPANNSNVATSSLAFRGDILSKVNAYKGRLKALQSLSESYDQKAAELNSRAKEFASALPCAG